MIFIRKQEQNFKDGSFSEIKSSKQNNTNLDNLLTQSYSRQKNNENMYYVENSCSDISDQPINHRQTFGFQSKKNSLQDSNTLLMQRIDRIENRLDQFTNKFSEFQSQINQIKSNQKDFQKKEQDFNLKYGNLSSVQNNSKNITIDQKDYVDILTSIQIQQNEQQIQINNVTKDIENFQKDIFQKLNTEIQSLRFLQDDPNELRQEIENLNIKYIQHFNQSKEQNIQIYEYFEQEVRNIIGNQYETDQNMSTVLQNYQNNQQRFQKIESDIIRQVQMMSDQNLDILNIQNDLEQFMTNQGKVSFQN